MKRLDFTWAAMLVLFLVVSQAQAGWIENGSDIYTSEIENRLEGNVGIWTNELKDKLNIWNTKGVTFHDGGHKALSWNAYFDGHWKYLDDDFAFQIYIDYSNDKVRFRIAEAWNKDNVVWWKEFMAFDNNKNVGIGTVNPQWLLHVKSPTYGANWVHFAQNNGGVMPANEQGLAFGWNRSNAQGESSLVYNTTKWSKPRLEVASYDGVNYISEFVVNNGKIGIATDDPLHDLQIGEGLGVNRSIAIQSGLNDTSSFVWEASDGSDRFTQYTNLESYTEKDLLIFRSVKADNQLVLKWDGNIGIATTNPTEKLEVNGNIKTTGKIIADQIVAEGDLCLGKCN